MALIETSGAGDLGGLLALAPMDPLFFVSFWKPLILLVTLAAWAWVISRIYDKHAARFFLPREKWNIFHMCMGLASFAIALVMPGGPWAIWIGWVVMLILLTIDLVVYAMVANRDERVPEAFRIKLDIVTKLAAAREAKKQSKAAGTVKLAIRGADKNLVAPPAAESPEFEVRTASESIYLRAMEARASQVDLAPTSKDGAYTAMMLVDGVRQNGDTFPAPVAKKIIDFWKAAAKLDLADVRKKLSGEIAVDQGNVRHKVKVTSMGVQGGMRLTLLFDADSAVKRKVDEIGLLDTQLEELKAIVNDPKRGVVVLGGIPDGGRTTMFYSILGMHDSYTLGVQTLEMEPQLTLEGVRHQAFEPLADGPDYATTVRSIFRRDPDVVGMAEMPDAATAQEVSKTDFERTRGYLFVNKAENALAAIELYTRAVGDPALAAKSLRGAVAGRLLRKLCVNCRVGYTPTPDMLKKLGVNDAAKVPQLFKKGGQVLIKNKPEVCPVCAGVGYIGQEGIFEVYHLGDEERDLIAASNFAGLAAALRKRQLPTIQQSAVRKALTGVTSVEEVLRVTKPPSAGAAGPAPAPSPAPSMPSKSA